MATSRKHRAAFVSLVALATVGIVAIGLWVPSWSGTTRVIWAGRLGSVIWWLGTLLSLTMFASIVVVLLTVILRPAKRLRPDRQDDSPAGADTSDIDRRRLRRPKLRRIWFAIALLWLTLESVGGIWMMSDRLRRQSVGAPDAHPSQILESPSYRALPEEFLPQQDESFVLVAMGGSTAGGDPYSPTRGVLYTSGFSFTEAAGMRLQEQFPNLPIRSFKLALGGGTLESAYDLLCDLSIRPDVIVIYSGHNELFTRFPADREAVELSGSSTPSRGSTNRLFPPSLIARCVERRLKSFSVAAVPPTQARRRLFDRPLFTPAEADEVYARFHDLLQRIVHYCRQQKIEPVLIIPAANESGFEPNRSWLPSDFPQQDKDTLQDIYEHLDSGRLSDKDRVEQLESALSLAPQFAETNFRLGKEYERLGRDTDARQCYQAAIDFDGYPLRASSRIAEIYRSVADQYDTILIDAREVLRRQSSNGILGDELIHDNCHPNVRGYAALADALVTGLAERGIPAGDRSGPSEPLSAQDLVRYFSIDRNKWAEVFAFVGRDYSGNLSLLRYDNRTRQDKGRAYLRAAERIDEGTYPTVDGIPDTRVLSPSVEIDRPDLTHDRSP